ncbi:MAG: hypothetical protein KGJ43_07880, partial [Acidobacteriota bacterium]|nr:hypothetical protein [Acidobacteriota bacterium]
WTDSSGNENGDKCAWISTGQGASQDITLTTGSFAVQSTWANDFEGGAGGCEISHPIVVSEAPSQLAVSTAPASTAAGSSFTVGVSVERANGSVVSSGAGSTDSIKLAVASGPAPALASCTANPVAASAGVATFSCTLDTAGTYTLAASDQTEGSVTSATSAPFTITAGAASKLAFSTAPVGTSAGSSLPIALSLQDSNGNAVPGVAVTLSITPGTGGPGAALACGASDTATTNSSGIASFSCSIDAAGTGYTLTAVTSLPSLSATSSSFTITAVPASGGGSTGAPPGPESAGAGPGSGPSTARASTASPPSARGTAVAAPAASVKGGSALIALRCIGGGSCAGTLKLVERVRRVRVARRHGRRRTVRTVRTVVIGTASFSIAAGGSITLRVRVTAKGNALLRRARKKGLRVNATGSDVGNGTLVLRQARRFRLHARGAHRRRG